MTDIDTKNELKWDIDVSILTNKYIQKEMLKVLGIATFVTATIVLFDITSIHPQRSLLLQQQ
ncbi:hypothetical protein [Methanolobus sp. ZRKC5]|uniref:hypothetical protein n=1 Tax=unclassified Methanolobus TaxID=2629569 RepID=UPI00313B3B02